jgi:hypothetical protein
MIYTGCSIWFRKHMKLCFQEASIAVQIQGSPSMVWKPEFLRLPDQHLPVIAPEGLFVLEHTKQDAGPSVAVGGKKGAEARGQHNALSNS